MELHVRLGLRLRIDAVETFRVVIGLQRQAGIILMLQGQPADSIETVTQQLRFVVVKYVLYNSAGIRFDCAQDDR